MPEPISEVQLMVGDEEPGPLDTKLLRVGDDGELVGTLLQRLHLTEVDGRRPGPCRCGGVIGTLRQDGTSLMPDKHSMSYPLDDALFIWHRRRYIIQPLDLTDS
jgi:hypothetical protein